MLLKRLSWCETTLVFGEWVSCSCEGLGLSWRLADMMEVEDQLGEVWYRIIVRQRVEAMLLFLLHERQGIPNVSFFFLFQQSILQLTTRYPRDSLEIYYVLPQQRDESHKYKIQIAAQRPSIGQHTCTKQLGPDVGGKACSNPSLAIG